MSTIVESRAIDAYVHAVEQALGPALLLTHQELVEDLVDHLTELSTEEGDSLTDRLGPPDVYAAELLASAGIEVRNGRGRSLGDRWPELLAARRAMGERLRLDRLADLRPAWWVIRGWALVALVTVVNSDNRDLYPVADVLGNPPLNVAALVGAVAGSVWLARRGGWQTTVVTIAAAVGLLAAIGEGDQHHAHDVAYDNGPGLLTGPDGRVIHEIWPYDGEGNALDGVFLFDQDGNPITVGGYAEPGQVTIPGLFPQRQGQLLGRDPGREAPLVSIPLLPTPDRGAGAVTTATAGSAPATGPESVTTVAGPTTPTP